MSVGKNGNGRKSITQYGIFADENAAREWAKAQYPQMDVLLVNALAMDCASDEAGTSVGNGICFEIVLAEPLTDKMPEEVVEPTRAFWEECGFGTVQTISGHNLVDLLIKHKIRPIDLALIAEERAEEEFERVFSQFVVWSLDLYRRFKEALRS